MDVHSSALPVHSNETTNDPQRQLIVIFFNPKAGPTERVQLFDQTCQRLNQQLGVPALVITTKDGLLEQLSDGRRHLIRCLVVAGGDGTVHWVINQARDVPIAVWPFGSENLLAKTLGVTRDPDAMVRLVTEGVIRSYDLGRIETEYFVLMASAGIDADVVHHVHERRVGHISKWNYIQSTWTLWWQRRCPRIRVRIDGSPRTHSAAQVIVFNWAEYALGLPICPQADPTDGKLDVVLLKRAGLTAMLGYLIAVTLRRQSYLQEVKHFRASSITLESRKTVHIQADGDPVDTLPVEIQVVPKGISLLVRPPGNR